MNSKKHFERSEFCKKTASVFLSSALMVSAFAVSGTVNAATEEAQESTDAYAVSTTASSAGLSKYYSRNASNGVGKNKTITVDGDISDWDSTMLIAQGTANDDPRVYRPAAMNDLPMDLYALYGAYDDDNLYLMWEMTNVQDVVAPENRIPMTRGLLYQSANVPFFLAVDTGEANAVGNNGKIVTGGTLWDSGITFEKQFNRLIAFSSNGSVGPYVYAGNDNGLNPVEIYTPQASGIVLKYGKGINSKNVYGINGYGKSRKVGDVSSDTSAWIDFNTKSHKSAEMDFHYEMLVPLKTLGVTKDDIENKGIGALLVLTSGKSGMDCLPYDLSMNDNADQSDAANSTEAASYEKSDSDHIKTDFARIGKDLPSIIEVTSVSLNKTSASVTVGSTVALTASVAPENATDQTIIWSSSDTSVATVSSTGVVKGIKAGTATITAKSSNGKTAKATITVTAVLKNVSVISATTLSLGDELTVTGKATGGASPYQYAVYYKKATSDKWSAAQSYSTNATVKIKPTAAVDYDIRVKVKDAAGKIVGKDFKVTVQKGLTNTSALSASSIELGNEVTVNCKASSGTSPYQYAVYYKKATSDKWSAVQSYNTNATVKIKPTAAVDYDIRVKVKDAAGSIASKDFSLKVTDTQLKNTSKISATTINLGEFLKITASATGGTKPYTYAVYAKKVSSEKWTTIQNYSSNASVEYKPAAATSYDICVKVKDKTGKIVKSYFTVIVNKAYAASVQVSSNSIKAGASVKVTASASGGKAPYSYEIAYLKSGTSTWKVAKTYNTNTTKTIIFADKGTYNVRVAAKDSSGQVAYSYVNVTVS